MKTALFTNFTKEEFIGYWDGKGKKFAPGKSLYMPDYLAQHFAKHLANRELLRREKDGSLVIPNGEKYVSPKKPEEVSEFMNLFNKAYTPEKEENEDDLGTNEDEIDTLINISNKNREESKGATGTRKKPGQKTKVPKDMTDEDTNNEDAFQSKPKD